MMTLNQRRKKLDEKFAQSRGRKTRDASYRATLAEGKMSGRMEGLLKLIGETPGITRRQLNIQSGLTINVVTSLVRRLLDKGRICESGEVFDAETRRTVATLSVVNSTPDVA
jgi:predicted HTH transcriptional regulator